MRRKITAMILATLMLLALMPMSTFAAAPSVREVETLIAQIGTVSRENRSAVEKAVNAYNQLDDASKAGVSNFDVLAEAQQILGIKDALAKLDVGYDKVEGIRTITSPYYLQAGDVGLCDVIPIIYTYENQDEPFLTVTFSYVGDEVLNADKIIVRVGDNKYTYNQKAFIAVQRGAVKISTGATKYAEFYGVEAEDFEIDLLRDALSSDEAIFRFSGQQSYDYILTPQNRQAITDVLNAYNLMCDVSPEVLRKALE